MVNHCILFRSISNVEGFSIIIFIELVKGFQRSDLKFKIENNNPTNWKLFSK